MYECAAALLFALERQIPQGPEWSDEEDEMYEEVEDTSRQHSQFTKWYIVCSWYKTAK